MRMAVATDALPFSWGLEFLTGKLIARPAARRKHLAGALCLWKKFVGYNLRVFAQRLMYSLMSTVIELNPTGADFHMEVASRLRIGLSALGLKSKDVAQAIGMVPSAFSKRTRGVIVMNVAEVDQIATATGLSRSWLLTGEGPMLSPGGGGLLRARRDSNSQPSVLYMRSANAQVIQGNFRRQPPASNALDIAAA